MSVEISMAAPSPELIGDGTCVPVSAVTGFDYAALSVHAADLATRAAAKIRRHQQRVSREIIDIGADLVRVQDALGHGYFCAWLEAEFGWTDRTARNYMRAAKAFGAKSETVSVLPPATLYLLSAKSTPETIVSEVIAKLEHSDCVDSADIKARVKIARQQAQVERGTTNKRKAGQRRAAHRKFDVEQSRQKQERRRAEELAAEKRVAALIFAKFDADELAGLIEKLNKTWWGGFLVAHFRDDGGRS